MRLASATISSSLLFSRLARLFGHESEPRPTAVAIGMTGIRAPSPRAVEGGRSATADATGRRRSNRAKQCLFRAGAVKKTHSAGTRSHRFLAQCLGPPRFEGTCVAHDTSSDIDQ
jgi:hypothetical protein